MLNALTLCSFPLSVLQQGVACLSTKFSECFVPFGISSYIHVATVACGTEG